MVHSLVFGIITIITKVKQEWGSHKKSIRKLWFSKETNEDIIMRSSNTKTTEADISKDYSVSTIEVPIFLILHKFTNAFKNSQDDLKNKR